MAINKFSKKDSVHQMMFIEFVINRLSSELTGRQTLLMKFEDVEFKDEFDGIWACASLLHVPKAEIINVMRKLVQNLKENGIFFGSFKYVSSRSL